MLRLGLHRPYPATAISEPVAATELVEGLAGEVLTVWLATSRGGQVYATSTRIVSTRMAGRGAEQRQHHGIRPLRRGNRPGGRPVAGSVVASAGVLQPRYPSGRGTSLAGVAPPPTAPEPARRRLTGLLERERELQQLRDLVATAAFGAGQVVLVEGEAGVGKTSLLRAFLASLPLDAAVWQGHCDPLATPRPFAPLHDIGRPGGPLGSLQEEEAPPFDVSRAVLEGLTVGRAEHYGLGRTTRQKVCPNGKNSDIVLSI